MKKIYSLVILCLFALTSSAQTNFHDYSATTIDHDTISMGQFYGKKVMVVNTASYCGYTYQFAALENLYSNYKQYGFEIIGFPCNDFANQDPNSDSAINQFCTSTYNVTFQMMSKIKAITADTAPLYKWLQREDLNGVSDAHVSWNFNKFLIDESGHWVRHYTQDTEPDDSAIIHWIVDTASVISGIKENKANDFIELKSANPGNTIDFVLGNTAPQNVNINLYSSSGQYVKTIFTGATNNSQTISSDVSQLASGIYLISIAGNGIQKTLKYVRVK